MRRHLYLLVAIGLVATGCTPRFQGGEAFLAATTPVDYSAERAKPDSWKGDPGAFGGVADANGGQMTATSYGRGARKDAPEPLDTKLNQPAKGVGGNRGDYPVYADPSYGNTNAPFAQPGPSSVGQMR